MKLHELRAMRHKRSMAPRIEKIPKYKYRTNYNFSKALKKAEKGHLFSILEIIDCYHRGIGGVKKDEQEYIKWLIKATEQGDVLAMRDLGRYYYDKRDYAESFIWYVRAADHGDILAHSLVENWTHF